MSMRAHLTVGLTVCLLVACDDSEGPQTHDAHAGHSDAGGVPLDDEFRGCPESAPPFTLGMQASGNQGHLRATLVAASNVPPLRYLNDWTVDVQSASGAPLTDVQLTNARPFMPVHGHDGIVKPTVQRLAEPGRFSVRGFNLNMRGPWEIQLTAGSASAGDDYIVFHICVAE